MSLPVKTLPVVQNWDCHVTGTCCHEYRVTLSADEVERIEKQGWTREDLGGMDPFEHSGIFTRTTRLNHRPDGACVFLGPEGRCRIHEKHGYETKPLPCRLFPFVLVPAGDHWRVGLRYGCPSAAANKGRALPEHQEELIGFAAQLAAREKLEVQPDGTLGPPPRQDHGERLDWPDTLRLVDLLVRLLTDRKDGFERRMRRCLYVADVMRSHKVKHVRGADLANLLETLRTASGQEAPPHPMVMPPPRWMGRMLFRQACALYTRLDHGPKRGVGTRGYLARLGAAWRFARGRGAVPRLHAGLPECNFEELEVPRGPLLADAEEVLERYYSIKVGSLQFCGAASFGLPFWEGFEQLAMTLPVILWVSRMHRDRPRVEGVTQALTVVDYHVGFNPVLATGRQRVSFSMLARGGELAKLAAWYSR